MTVIGIEINIDASKAMNSLDRFMKKEVGRLISKEVAHQLVEQMKSRVPFWRWNLYNSIQSRQTRDGYHIQMLQYGLWLEKGHKINVMTPLLSMWAFAKIADPVAFARMIYYRSHGSYKFPKSPYETHPHPFIQPSIDYVAKDLDTTSIKIINKALKESGFK